MKIQPGENRFRNLIDNLPDPVLEINLDGQIIYANHTAKNIMGLAYNDIWQVLSQLHTDEKESSSEIWQHILSGKVKKLEVGLENGKTVEFKFSVFKDQNGTASKLIIAGRDISKDKETKILPINFKMVADKANYGIAMSDLEGTITYCNKSFAKMHGLTFEETIGKNLGVFHSEEQMPRALELKEKLEKEGSFSNEELWHTRKDGTVFPTLMEGMVIRNDDGKPLFLAVTCLEITDIKEAHKENEFLRSALEQSSEGIALADLEGNLLYLNNAFAQMHGYSPDEAVGRHLSVFHSADQMDEVEASVRTVIDKGSFNGMIWHKRRDDTTFPTTMQNTLVRDQFGKPIALLGTLRDITEQYQTQKELKDYKSKLEDLVEERTKSLEKTIDKLSNEMAKKTIVEKSLAENKSLLEAILNNSPSAIYLKDTQGRYIFINNTGAEMTGKKVADFIGRTDSEIFPWQEAEMLRDSDLKVIDTGIPFQTDEIVVLPDGIRSFLSIKFPIMNEGGDLWGVGGISSDITDRKRIMSELETAKAQSDQRAAELESFSYSVSHDLKAPLRGIDGYAKLLEDGYAGQLDEEGLYFLKMLRQSAQQMDQLIEDLLKYSRLDRMKIEFQEVDLLKVIERILNRDSQILEKANIGTAISLKVPKVVCEPEGFAHAVDNLLQNAVKFSRTSPKPKVAIDSYEKDGEWIIAIRDNGIGFDMQYHDRIFNIFQRLEKSEDYPGTGVGLAITKKVMERMKGRVWAESERGKGATFYLALPKKEGAFNTQG